ncbi:CASP-like protein 4D1 [Benincasa hispida]|uniref:CASP-like protein 4D1 n=1 Tax=Benincasa hispida TaxID=102211 RepID=UPI0019008C81|nr:CASP-like protein 4D1 [Benincasa hispida]
MEAKMGSKIASLVLRVVTFVFLLISIIVLATNSKTIGDAKFHFHNVNSYRYAITTIIIGGAFNLLQIALALYRLVTKTDGNLLFDFYGDKVLSYVLLSGAAAALGSGIDLKANLEVLASFFDHGNAGAALLLLAFFCSAVVSVLSSLALSNKAN